MSLRFVQTSRGPQSRRAELGLALFVSQNLQRSTTPKGIIGDLLCKRKDLNKNLHRARAPATAQLKLYKYHYVTARYVLGLMEDGVAVGSAAQSVTLTQPHQAALTVEQLTLMVILPSA